MCIHLLRRGLVAVATALALLVATAAPASAGTFTAGTLGMAGGSISLVGGLCTGTAAPTSLSLSTSGFTATVTDFDSGRYLAVLGSGTYLFAFDDSVYFGANTGTRISTSISGLHLGLHFTISQVGAGCSIGAVDTAGYAGVTLNGSSSATAFSFTGSSANSIELSFCQTFCSWDTGAAVPNGWAGNLP